MLEKNNALSKKTVIHSALMCHLTSVRGKNPKKAAKSIEFKKLRINTRIKIYKIESENFQKKNN